MSNNKSNQCPEPEDILCFLEQKTPADEQLFIAMHLAECQTCKAAAKFVCAAVAAEKAGTLEPLTGAERIAAAEEVKKMLRQDTSTSGKTLWNCFLEHSKLRFYLSGVCTEPEVLAAAAEHQEIIFRAQTDKNDPQFWEASLQITNLSSEKLQINLTNGKKRSIDEGIFALCSISAEVKNGVCFISRSELAAKLDTGGVSFRYPGGKAIIGQPLLTI